MNKGIALFGAYACSLLSTIGSADAKMIHYEINGQRYSYSTNNRKQTEEARQRINAANAAAGGNVNPGQNSAGNPLARIFGPQGQAPQSPASVQQAAPVLEVERTSRRRRDASAERRAGSEIAAETDVVPRADRTRSNRKTAALRSSNRSSEAAASKPQKSADRVAQERREKPAVKAKSTVVATRAAPPDVVGSLKPAPNSAVKRDRMAEKAAYAAPPEASAPNSEAPRSDPISSFLDVVNAMRKARGDNAGPPNAAPKN
jgi:hypothetical protein